MATKSLVIDLREIKNYSFSEEQKNLINKLDIPVYVLERDGKEITLRNINENIPHRFIEKATNWNEVSSHILPKGDGSTQILTVDAHSELLRDAVKTSEVKIEKIKSPPDLTDKLKELPTTLSQEKSDKKVYVEFNKKSEPPKEKIYDVFQKENKEIIKEPKKEDHYHPYMPKKTEISSSTQKESKKLQKEDHYQPQMPRKTEISSPTQKGTRLDKRLFHEGKGKLKHTVIISKKGREYELIGTLDSKESRELYEQTQMRKRGKVELGSGFAGRVRLIKDAKTGEYIAVKKVRDPQKFKDEEKVNEELDEKHIAGVLAASDSFEGKDHQGRPTTYQIMPIASSGTGRDFINDALPHLNPEEKKVVSTELACSLTETFSEMNDAGFYHRDLKPENLLIGDKKVYVADFGSATMYKNEDLVYDVGPMDSRYFAPETANDQQLKLTGRERDANLDSWRLGITLFQTLSPEADAYATKYLLQSNQWHQSASYDTKVKYYKDVMQSEEVKTHLESAPKPVANVISGLLEPDYHNRLTTQEAAKQLEDVKRPDSNIVDSAFDKVKHHTGQASEKRGRQKELTRLGNEEKSEVTKFKEESKDRRDRLSFVGGDGRSSMGKFTFFGGKKAGEQKQTAEENKKPQPSETKGVKPGK